MLKFYLVLTKVNYLSLISYKFRFFSNHWLLIQKGLRALSNATLDNLADKVGKNCAKSVYEYFNMK
jgi:hypothetical protein